MTTITTNDIRVKNAVNLRESLISTSLDNLSYLFIGGVLPWENEELPPIPENNFRTFYDVHDQMVAMKRINERDVYHMIPKVNYTSGLVYDIYRHDYSLTNRSNSGASNLYDAVFFVINSLNEVYVCLFNNNNKKSTVEPRSNSYVPFYTSDGYQWLKMYTLTASMVAEHTTENFIPITDDESHISVQGPIYSVIVESPGNNYTINPDGVVNRVLKYYCRIVGDGSDGVATVTVRDGKIKEVKVVRPGTNYTYATLDFVKGRVYESLLDLDQNMNGLNPLGDGTFRSTCIIAPPNGWGTDLVRQLGGTRLGIFSDLNYNLLDFVFESSFRQIGVLQNPLSDSRFPEEFDTLSACFAIATTHVSGPDRYIIGETIIQEVQEGNGQIQIAKGQVIGYDENAEIVKFIQIPSLHTHTDGELYRFTGVRPIVGEDSQKIASARPENGYLEGQTFIDGFSAPEFKKYSGIMTYLTNIIPVTRQESQSERISLIISY